MPRSVVEKRITAHESTTACRGGLDSVGRWIRPAPATPRLERSGDGSLDAASVLFDEARHRIGALASLERSLEERIRRRWRQIEEDAAQRIEDLERELSARRERCDDEIGAIRADACAKGRAAGYEQGLEQGRKEGHRAGFAEGRRHGLAAGREEGRQEAAQRVEEEAGTAAAALCKAASGLRSRREALLAQARADVVQLAVEIARKLVKREVTRLGDVVLRNVERATELLLRRESVVILVNTRDVPIVEESLRRTPGWAQGFEALEVRGAGDVERGGCRLVSGAGVVDMTLRTQIELIEEALGLREPGADAPEESRSGLVTGAELDTEEQATC